jgi:hypothetical protein
VHTTGSVFQVCLYQGSGVVWENKGRKGCFKGIGLMRYKESLLSFVCFCAGLGSALVEWIG